MQPIADSPLRSLSILYRKSHIWLSEGCAPCGLTAAQAVVILVVCDHGALTQDEITYDIHPTEKATEVYPALQGQVEAGFGRMTARMTEAQRAQFQRLLALAADACLEREE